MSRLATTVAGRAHNVEVTHMHRYNTQNRVGNCPRTPTGISAILVCQEIQEIFYCGMVLLSKETRHFVVTGVLK